MRVTVSDLALEHTAVVERVNFRLEDLIWLHFVAYITNALRLNRSRLAALRKSFKAASGFSTPCRHWCGDAKLQGACTWLGVGSLHARPRRPSTSFAPLHALNGTRLAQVRYGTRLCCQDGETCHAGSFCQTAPRPRERCPSTRDSSFRAFPAPLSKVPPSTGEASAGKPPTRGATLNPTGGCRMYHLPGTPPVTLLVRLLRSRSLSMVAWHLLQLLYGGRPLGGGTCGYLWAVSTRSSDKDGPSTFSTVSLRDESMYPRMDVLPWFHMYYPGHCQLVFYCEQIRRFNDNVQVLGAFDLSQSLPCHALPRLVRGHLRRLPAWL